MKRQLVAIFLLVIVLSCFSQQIDSINNINYEYLLYDSHVFSGPLHYYENRLIVCNQYTIIEFIVLQNGELELVKIFETKTASYGKSFFNESKLYFLYNKNSLLNLMVFDLSISPMIKTHDIELPIASSMGGDSIVTENHLIFSDQILQRSHYYNKETLAYEGYIGDLYGYVTNNDSVVVKAFYLVEGNELTQTILRFYDIDDIYNYNQNNFTNEMVLSSFIWLSDLKIKEDILYVLGFTNLFLIDISDIDNPQEMFNIYTETESVLDSFYYMDANLYDDFLVTTTTGLPTFQVYNVSDYQNIYIEYEDVCSSRNFSNTSIVYPYLYVCSQVGIRAYDMSDNFELIYSYDKNPNNVTYYRGKNDFFIAIFDNQTGSITFYSALSNQILFTIGNDFSFNSVVSFSIEENMLFLLYRVNNNTFLDIYNLINGEPDLIFSNSIDIEQVFDANYINGFVYLTKLISFTNRETYVYQLIDNELVFYCTVPGIMNFESGVQDINYTVFNHNSRYYFRDINDPNNILFISPALGVHEGKFPYIISNNYLAGLFLYNSGISLYKHSFEENYFSEFHTGTYDNINVYNGIITDNGYDNSYISKYYSIIDDQFIEIGSIETDGRVVNTLFYPEHNKIVVRKSSGIHVYSFEYTVSESDQVVEYKRESFVYPNPVNGGEVNFKTTLNTSQMEISIYNVKGQLVKRSKDFQSKDGDMTFSWNKKNEQNQTVASGVYFYKIKTDVDVQTGKFLIIK